MSHDHSSATTNATMCEMSMVWNWQTIDTCILTEGWHITNRGMFAASCVGIALLGVLYEALQRFRREYDRLVERQLADSLRVHEHMRWRTPCRRATPVQQLVRAILHVLASGSGWLIMLILMSFNGYVFVSLLVGTGLGKFFCDWVVVRDEGYSALPPASADAEKSLDTAQGTPQRFESKTSSVDVPVLL